MKDSPIALPQWKCSLRMDGGEASGCILESAGAFDKTRARDVELERVSDGSHFSTTDPEISPPECAACAIAMPPTSIGAHSTASRLKNIPLLGWATYSGRLSPPVL